MEKNEILLQISHMYKSFGITKALQDVSLELRRGQILGLIGENGSGKSTLTSIVAALQPADSGEMYFKGEPYQPETAVEANQKGICMIQQEKGTFDALNVAQNIFIGKEDLFIKNGFLNSKKMEREAEKVLKSIHAEYIRSDSLIAELNFEDQKLVEVARAMYSEPEILIVDETTTALSRNGRDILYSLMNAMKEKGKSIIFISHDLDEITEVCDTVTILRDGIYISTIDKEQYHVPTLRKMMVGREVADDYYQRDDTSCSSDEVVLKMKNVFCRELKDISFELHKGEILGFGGLGDCGMHMLGKVAFGLIEPDLGKVEVADGTEIKNSMIATRKKIAYISKNRDQETLMVSSSIKDNICLASYPKISKGPFVFKKDEAAFVEKNSSELEIKMQNMDQYVMELSGGNKQKVALAKWLGFGADIFILDCPTRGIDIGVKTNIYQLMNELRMQGKSVIMISEELAEIIGMSDRVIVLKEGQISGEFRREEHITEHMLIEHMV